MPLVLANTILTVAGTILAETTLSFLGLGDPGQASWGDDARVRVLQQAASRTGGWWWLLAPGICGRRRRDGVHALSGARSRPSSTRR